MGNGGSGARARGLAAQRSGATAPITPIGARHEQAAAWQAAHPGAPREVNPATMPREANGVLALTPIAHVGTREPNPGLAPDANYLNQLYGGHQLGAALSRYRAEDLRLAAEGAGVSNKGTRADLLSRITSHVTGGHYSANFPKEGAAKSANATKPAAASKSGGKVTITQARGNLEAALKSGDHAQLVAAAKALVAADKAASRSSGAGKAKAKAEVNLTPVARIESHEINISRTQDASFLRALYGDRQLTAAVSRYPLPKLHEMQDAAGIPRNSSKAAAIRNIVAAVTKEPYDQTLRRYGGRPIG